MYYIIIILFSSLVGILKSEFDESEILVNQSQRVQKVLLADIFKEDEALIKIVYINYIGNVNLQVYAYVHHHSLTGWQFLQFSL